MSMSQFYGGGRYITARALVRRPGLYFFSPTWSRQQRRLATLSGFCLPAKILSSHLLSCQERTGMSLRRKLKDLDAF